MSRPSTGGNNRPNHNIIYNNNIPPVPSSIIPPPSSSSSNNINNASSPALSINVSVSDYPFLPNSDPNFDPEAELIFLHKLDRKCVSLERKGQIIYAIELMEQGLSSRKLLYGQNSPPVLEAAEKLCILYNSLAMSSLYKEEYKVYDVGSNTMLSNFAMRSKDGNEQG